MYSQFIDNIASTAGIKHGWYLKSTNDNRIISSSTGTAK